MRHQQSEEVSVSEAERIAYAYRTAAAGNTWDALVQAVQDALADLAEGERRTRQEHRLISRGYVRGVLDSGQD